MSKYTPFVILSLISLSLSSVELDKNRDLKIKEIQGETVEDLSVGFHSCKKVDSEEGFLFLKQFDLENQETFIDQHLKR